MKRHVLTALLPLLAGCQSVPVSSLTSTPDALQQATQERQTDMYRLHQAGVINQMSPTVPGQITANSQRITLAWDGDAVELLNTLARQRGYRLVYSGTRLPLPVNVYVTDMTFNQVLDLIRVQTGWRATLSQKGIELRLHFSLPDKGDRTV
ncbi:DotD/TraH family lipoprotein [Dryocola sp. BD626]|uniref:DotD/TraH family lipoprotein n=1 Tax=Dryocola sp. BD626 TaxID=3133273 RepID=UPI003F5055A5